MKNLIVLICFSLISVTIKSQDFSDRLALEEKSFKSKGGKKIDGEMGRLQVPENRNNPNSEKINIHFVRLKSTNPNPGAPLVYLEGGPGSSCTWQAQDPGSLSNWLPFLALGDVILLDQRGTGEGTQRVLYIKQEDPPNNILSDLKVLEERSQIMSKEALAEYDKRGVDLRGYTTIENARDIDELRQALGYKKISLFGFSYGTHLGQTYIKYHGQNVENAILVGVEGLNHTYKLPSSMDTHFHKLSLMAKADPNVNQEVPDLMVLYKKVVEQLRTNPVPLEIRSPLTNQNMTMEIGPFGLNLILRFDIGDASDLPVFPRLLHSIDQGDYEPLKWFVQKRINIFYGIHGMSATMDPASGATATRLQRIKNEGENSLFQYVVNPGLLDESQWPTPDLGDEFRAPLISSVRTLFMSGTLDFNTPPFQAEEVRWGFSNSSHVIVDQAGHEQIMTHPKATETMVRFLKGENVDDVALFYPTLRFIPIKGKSKELWHPSLGKR